MRTTDHKLSCWVDVISDLIIKKFLNRRFALFLDSWNDDLNYIFPDLIQHFLITIKIIMLSRNNNCIYTNWIIVIIVFDRYLAFCIGTKVFQFFSSTTGFRKLLQNFMSKIQSQRHIVI